VPVRQYPWAKPSGDHIPLGGFVHLNPATLRCDNGVDYLESRRAQQEKPVTKPEKEHRDSYQKAVIPAVRRAYAAAQGGPRSSDSSVWKSTTQNGHRALITSFRHPLSILHPTVAGASDKLLLCGGGL
jgi:hypothetical protein